MERPVFRGLSFGSSCVPNTIAYVFTGYESSGLQPEENSTHGLNSRTHVCMHTPWDCSLSPAACHSIPTPPPLCKLISQKVFIKSFGKSYIPHKFVN